MYKSILFFIIILCCYCEPDRISHRKEYHFNSSYCLLPSPVALHPPSCSSLSSSRPPRRRWHPRKWPAQKVTWAPAVKGQPRAPLQIFLSHPIKYTSTVSHTCEAALTWAKVTMTDVIFNLVFYVCYMQRVMKRGMNKRKTVETETAFTGSTGLPLFPLIRKTCLPVQRIEKKTIWH